MRTRTMTQAKNDICSIIRDAETEQIIITRHGRPAAVIIGFKDEEDWFDFRLQHDEGFLKKIAKARAQIRNGDFVSLDDLKV